jgi:hypothetical protein
VRWTRTLPGSIAHNYAPTPDGRSVLISDGWHVAYVRGSLRRLDLASGAIAAEARLGDFARCFDFDANGERVLAAFDKRLRLIDVATLEVLQVWDRRVPRYADHVAWDGEHALLRNQGGTGGIIDLTTGRVRRTPGGKGAVRRLDDGTVVVAASGDEEGIVWAYDSLGGKPRRVETIGPFEYAAVDEDGSVTVARTPVEAGAGEHWIAHRGRFDAVVRVDRRRAADDRRLAPIVPPRDHQISAMFPGARVAFSRRDLHHEARAEIACLEAPD